MRAYGFRAPGGPEQEAFLDVPEPVAGPGELLVRVRAAAVNPGDWRVREGSYGIEGSAVLGREVAGTVVAGDGFAPGDEVFGGCPGMVGGFAPFALVTASFAAHRPPSVTPEDAAALPVAAGTAWDALAGLDLPAGSTLLVNGAGGGVGVVTVQLAVARGLRVVGVASARKHELIARLGGEPVAPGAATQPVDAVFDLVGGAALRSVAGLCPPSRLRSVADKPLVKELGGAEVVRDRSTAVLDALATLVAKRELDPLVGKVLPFDEAPAAMRAVEAGHEQGKVVLRLP